MDKERGWEKSRQRHERGRHYLREGWTVRIETAMQTNFLVPGSFLVSEMIGAKNGNKCHGTGAQNFERFDHAKHFSFIEFRIASKLLVRNGANKICFPPCKLWFWNPCSQKNKTSISSRDFLGALQTHTVFDRGGRFLYLGMGIGEWEVVWRAFLLRGMTVKF